MEMGAVGACGFLTAFRYPATSLASRSLLPSLMILSPTAPSSNACDNESLGFLLVFGYVLVCNSSVATLFSPYFKCCFVIAEVVFPPSGLICVSHPFQVFPDGVGVKVCLEVSLYRIAYVPANWRLVSID
ncbi:hypothetical protein L484_002932 [Morus notabilis]|uniref:Uncharacterized protein n=1 Tax=Morus notabilis TaxID=981085 RepID=W9R1I5_9ROSA|nr:hypothetical protein L484_002932 [Morus notabilis]